MNENSGYPQETGAQNDGATGSWDEEAAYRPPLRIRTYVIGLVVVAAVVTAAFIVWDRLRGDEYKGDEAKFCELWEDQGRTHDTEELEELYDVAPVDIRETVGQLRDASHNLDEMRDSDIDHVDLAEYFRAAFSEETEQAETELSNFADDLCV